MAKSEMCSLMEPQRLPETKSTPAGVFVVVCGGIGWAWPHGALKRMHQVVLM